MEVVLPTAVEALGESTAAKNKITAIKSVLVDLSVAIRSEASQGLYELTEFGIGTLKEYPGAVTLFTQFIENKGYRYTLVEVLDIPSVNVDWSNLSTKTLDIPFTYNEFIDANEARKIAKKANNTKTKKDYIKTQMEKIISSGGTTLETNLYSDATPEEKEKITKELTDLGYVVEDSVSVGRNVMKITWTEAK